MIKRRLRRSVRRPRQLFFEQMLRVYFRGNAFVAILVLALITLFLLREGFGFFGQNLDNLRVYRQAGLEYVDIIRAKAEQHSALTRSLNELREKQLRAQPQANLAAIDQFSSAFSDTAENLHGLVSDLTDEASALKEQLAVAKAPLNRETQLTPLRQHGDTGFVTASATMTARVNTLLAQAPRFPSPKVQDGFEKWKTETRDYLASFPETTRQLHDWSSTQPVAWYRTITSFLFGRDWITASFWQDWYGIIPLLVGSIMVSIVALVIAAPVGVAAAIYVSEIALPNEKKFIKPCIEFIAAIPSVVLGFFGIAVVGQAIRAASQSHLLSWVSFFPISERLNVFTAGVLLALMAVPTIFTLAEDSLRNVPRGFKEASYALGANRLQTIGRVLVPASLSGIVSAILLGLGRVIGETMVVLLCAGNRIAIPDFTQGLGAFFQPVHTMTGIIAQEMGEVVRGSMHYRALFMVGLVLFTLTLGINYLAQKIVARYRMSIG